MTLPEICPLDENQTCKGRECHLFCLEWRTREPICLIGYSTTSKVKSGRDDRNRDTYAEETFRKLNKQPASRKSNVTGKGDWTPTRPQEQPGKKLSVRPGERSVQNPEFQPSNSFNSQNTPLSRPEPKNERKSASSLRENPSLKGNHNINEAEEASARLETRLREGPADEKPIIFAKIQPVQEKVKSPEKVISRDKNTTIFSSSETDERKNFRFSDRENKAKRTSEDNEKRKKLNEIMEIDAPDVYDKEFWS